MAKKKDSKMKRMVSWFKCNWIMFTLTCIVWFMLTLMVYQSGCMSPLTFNVTGEFSRNRSDYRVQIFKYGRFQDGIRCFEAINEAKEACEEAGFKYE